MKTILITGGAGYLGTNIALALLKSNYNIVIVDNLENSYKMPINKLCKNFDSNIKFYKGNSCNYNFMKKIFQTNSIDQVLHLAGYKYVDESFSHPRKYTNNNLNSLKTILDLCEEFNIKRFAFASSAMVYGNCEIIPTSEDVKASPLSPYAKTKADGECMITDWHIKTKIPSTIFRFSNPAGANTKFMFGDRSRKGQQNLIPYIIKSAIQNKQLIFKGNDHPTKDGTSIRDYIHVSDLANIVSIVLNKSIDSGVEILNVSKGIGFSLQEIINCTEKILNKKLDYTFTKRSQNELSVSILNNKKLCDAYNINYSYSIEDIVRSEFEFYKNSNKNKQF